MDKWQPIETAPKDGSAILTFPHYVVTSYDELLNGFARWSECEDQSVLLRPQPTHWMPLPSPPEPPNA